MSAEGMPEDEMSLLATPLRWLTQLVLRFPAATLAIGVAVALASIGLSATRLGFRTSRLDLLNPDHSYNRLWLDYLKEFGDQEDVVIVVEGSCREEVVPVLAKLSERLQDQSDLFQAVLHEVDLTKVRAKGLHYLKPEELAGIEQFLDRADPIVRGDWTRLSATNTIREMLGGLRYVTGEQALAVEGELGRLVASLLAAMDERAEYHSPWPGMPGSVATMSESNYLLANEGRLGFVLLRLAETDKGSFIQGMQGIDSLRRLVRDVSAEHPATQIGLTGLPVLEDDEMRASQESMLPSNLLSLVGVSLLLVAGYGGLRHPLLGVASLLLAMAWSLGYLTLVIGHLNILSMAFGAMLIGLGDDFGMHYVARYLQLRRTVPSVDEALVRTAVGVGPGTLTGAATTAMGFFAAGLTEFKGVAELGVIAGGGILLCCLAAFTVLPAMIRLCDAKRRSQVLPAPLDILAGLKPLFAWPRCLLATTLTATLLVSLGLGRLWYDHNLLNLQAEGIESVALEKKLLDESDQSVWCALSIADTPEQVMRLRKGYVEQVDGKLVKHLGFEELPSVQRVEDIGQFFPNQQEQNLPLIARIHQRLANLPERSPKIPVDPPEELGQVLAMGQSMLLGNPRAGGICQQLARIRDRLRQMPAADYLYRLDCYQQRMAGDLLSRLHTLRAVSNPEPPNLGDLPEGLVTRFVGRNGRFLVKIYGKGSIWDMDAMEKFVRDVRSVDPKVTGNPLQAYEGSREMKRSYEEAAWYALAAILITIYVDFRSLRYTFLAMLPLGLGMLQMFGLLGLLNIPLNPANMVSVPLILGIGMESGVHVLHDFRAQSARYRMSPSTSSAVLITSLTTMVGFGSLMIASHRGLQSLGRVLTIGTSCCLFSSLVILPAFLCWISRNRLAVVEDRSDDSVGQDCDEAPRICRRESVPPGTGCRFPEARGSGARTNSRVA